MVYKVSLARSNTQDNPEQLFSRKGKTISLVLSRRYNFADLHKRRVPMKQIPLFKLVDLPSVRKMFCANVLDDLRETLLETLNF